MVGPGIIGLSQGIGTVGVKAPYMSKILSNFDKNYQLSKASNADRGSLSQIDQCETMSNATSQFGMSLPKKKKKGNPLQNAMTKIKASHILSNARKNTFDATSKSSR